MAVVAGGWSVGSKRVIVRSVACRARQMPKVLHETQGASDWRLTTMDLGPVGRSPSVVQREAERGDCAVVESWAWEGRQWHWGLVAGLEVHCRRRWDNSDRTCCFAIETGEALQRGCRGREWVMKGLGDRELQMLQRTVSWGIDPSTGY